MTKLPQFDPPANQNDFRSGQQTFFLTITASPDAPLGDRSLLLTNPDGSQGPAVFGILEVVPPGTLARTKELGTRAIAEKSPVTSIPTVTLPRR